MKAKKRLFFICLWILFCFSISFSLYNQNYIIWAATKEKVFLTDLNKTEKFLSIKSDKVNMRTGPNNRYNIKYTYIRKNMVFKILDSFEEWYKVQDIDGETGWIKKNLFFHSKKQRFAMIKAEKSIFCYANRDKKSKKIFKIDNLNMMHLIECRDSWCLVKKQKFKAWCESEFIWGSSSYK